MYSGAKKPLLNNYKTDNYFGNDGFGDFAFDIKITGAIDRSKHASIAMIELAKEYSGKFVVLFSRFCFSLN